MPNPEDLTTRATVVETAPAGMRALTDSVKSEALRLGFDLAGIASADPLPDHGERLRAWIEGGRHGDMDYMARRGEKAADPQAVVPGASAVVVVALYYRAPQPAEKTSAGAGDAEGPRGRVASYAWGDDYHLVMERGLRRLSEFLRAHGATVARYYVDTGPVLERALAQRAGIGWFGKNTTIITTAGFGSWVFLGEIFTDLALVPDRPAEGDCGLCALCMEHCPTGAIIAPGVLDARRCISYLTIEHRGWIPRDLRAPIGDMVFGCDICQDVCPWNRTARPPRHVSPGCEASHPAALTHPPAHTEFSPRLGVAFPELIPLLLISEEEFRARFRGSPIKRAKRSGLRRNAAVALGNSGDPRAVPALVQALDDPDPYVRGHAAWALGRLGGAEAGRAVARRLVVEPDREVREELRLALQDMDVTCS